MDIDTAAPQDRTKSARPTKIAKPRAVLTSEQAVAIFKLKPSGSNAKLCTRSNMVAKTYNIGEKTVRDIWCGRTWHEETQHLDPSRPHRKQAPPGRPLGRKDTVQRRLICSNQSPRSSQSEKSTKSLEEVHKKKSLEEVHNADKSTESLDQLIQDPFHDDWPNWHCATSFREEVFPPVVLYSQYPTSSSSTP
jgi:hypothetical protein